VAAVATESKPDRWVPNEAAVATESKPDRWVPNDRELVCSPHSGASMQWHFMTASHAWKVLVSG